MTDYPKIIINGKAYFQIACINCEFPSWSVFSNEDKTEFWAKCNNCGNIVQIKADNLQNEPERIKILKIRGVKE